MEIIDIDRSPKYPITPDGNKVCYLVLHLGVPLGESSASSRNLTVEKRIAKELGIKVLTVRTNTENSKFALGTERYIIRFPYFRRNDALASKIVDTLLVSASVTFGPFMDERDQQSVFRIPWELIKNRTTVMIGEIVQIEELRNWDERTTEFPSMLLGGSTSFSEHEVEAAWQLVPLLITNDDMLRAYRFIKTSQENFYVWLGEIEDAIDQADTTADNIFQQSRLEKALEDSFKAIEAVIGDPPKDDRKFKAKLSASGINPEEKIGLEDKPIYQVVREMNLARDKKAAHGSTRDRQISVGEVLVYQNCARYIVILASEKLLGFKLY